MLKLGQFNFFLIIKSLRPTNSYFLQQLCIWSTTLRYSTLGLYDLVVITSFVLFKKTTDEKLLLNRDPMCICSIVNILHLMIFFIAREFIRIRGLWQVQYVGFLSVHTFVTLLRGIKRAERIVNHSRDFSFHTKKFRVKF